MGHADFCSHAVSAVCFSIQASAWASLGKYWDRVSVTVQAAQPRFSKGTGTMSVCFMVASFDVRTVRPSQGIGRMGRSQGGGALCDGGDDVFVLMWDSNEPAYPRASEVVHVERRSGCAWSEKRGRAREGTPCPCGSGRGGRRVDDRTLGCGFDLDLDPPVGGDLGRHALGGSAVEDRVARREVGRLIADLDGPVRLGVGFRRGREGDEAADGRECGDAGDVGGGGCCAVLVHGISFLRCSARCCQSRFPEMFREPPDTCAQGVHGASRVIGVCLRVPARGVEM